MTREELKQLIREVVEEADSESDTRGTPALQRELKNASLQIEAIYMKLMTVVRDEYARRGFENLRVHIEKGEHFPEITVQGDYEAVNNALNITHRSGPYPGRQYRQFLHPRK